MTDRAPLVVAVDHVAVLTGLDPTVERVQVVVEAAIRAAQAAVEGHLGQPITPVEATATGVTWAGGQWLLPHTPTEILSVTAEVDGDGQPTYRYTVVYRYGLDVRARGYELIVEWVTAAAQVHPAVRKLVAEAGGRVVRSVSADGQSITYEPAPSASQVPTAGVPALSTLDRWRSVDGLVWQRPGRPVEYRRWW